MRLKDLTAEHKEAIRQNTVSQARTGDSCAYKGKKYYIKSIGQKYAVLVTMADYLKYGLRGRNLYGNKNPKGFRVLTADVTRIRYNYWNV